MKYPDLNVLLSAIVLDNPLAEKTSQYVQLKMAVDRIICDHGRNADNPEFRGFINSEKGIAFRGIITKYIYNRYVSRIKETELKTCYDLQCDYASEAALISSGDFLSRWDVKKYIKNQFSTTMTVFKVDENVRILFKEGSNIDILVEVSPNVEYIDEVLTDRITTLEMFRDTKFADADRYNGEHKIWFNLLKKLSEEEQGAVIEKLHQQLIDLKP